MQTHVIFRRGGWRTAEVLVDAAAPSKTEG
jgi:hypothetical protein